MALPSFRRCVAGASVGLKMVHGQVTGAGSPTVTVTTFADGAEPAASMIPESSKPRLFIVTVPAAEGVQVKVQLIVPLATCQVFPPSTEISTPATTLLSDALPEIVMGVPCGMVTSLDGEEMIVVGAIASVEAVAVVPVSNEPG